MIIIISRHNLLSACSSSKTWLQRLPSGEQMASPGLSPAPCTCWLGPQAVLICLHGVSFHGISPSQAGRGLAGSSGNSWPRCPGKQTEGLRDGQQLPSQAGLPEFYYRVLICSSRFRRAFGRLHTHTGVSGLTCALGVRGAGCQLLLPCRAPGWGVSTGHCTAAWSLAETLP